MHRCCIVLFCFVFACESLLAVRSLPSDDSDRVVIYCDIMRRIYLLIIQSIVRLIIQTIMRLIMIFKLQQIWSWPVPGPLGPLGDSSPKNNEDERSSECEANCIYNVM